MLVFSLLAAAAGAQSSLPAKPLGYVNDFANALSADGRNQLTALCTEVDQKAGAQIAVVTVTSLDGRPVEDYSLDLATKWGVGPKQSSRGILILLAINDHKYWTQVGYGLEGILPDGKVGGFGREALPSLRAGNYDAALLLMTRRVADVIALDKGVTLSGQPPPAAAVPVQDQPRGLFSNYFLIAIVVLVLLSLLRRRGNGPRGGGWMGPIIGGGMGGGMFGRGGFGGGGGGGGGFGGFGGGSFGGGGAGGSW